MINVIILYIDHKFVPMRINIFQFLLLAGLIFYFSIKMTFAQDVLTISDKKSYPVRDYLQALEASPAEGIAYVLNRYESGDFTKLHSPKPFNKGATTSIWWFALPMKNLLDIQNNVIFIAATQNAALITLYDNVNGEYVPIDYTGYSIPSKSKTLNSRLFSFELSLLPKEEKLYFISIDTQGGNLYLPFFMDDPYHFWVYEASRATHYGIFSGIFFLAFMISTFLWAKTREKIYGYYSLYILLSFFLILEEDGYAFWWIYGDFFPRLSMIIIPFTGTMGMVFMLQIMLAFHNFSKQNYIIYTFTRVSQCILIFLAATNLLFLLIQPSIGIRSFFYNMSFIGIIIGSFTALGGSVYKLLQGYKPARLYLLAICLMIIGLLNYSLNTLAITNFNIIYPNGIVVGITLEIIIMIFALAYRYHEMKKESDRLLLTLNQERKAVSDQILQTLENERERLAKDLHDDLGGLLALIKMQLSHLANQNTPLQPALNETHSLISKACNDLRAISHDLILEGQETRDLASMINEIIRYYEKNSNLQFQTYYKDIPQLDINTKITIFRMLKELIQNVIKHSKATECNIQLIYDRKILRIMVEDNGIGMNKNLNQKNNYEGIGLNNIKSRVDFLKGEMHMESNINGTTFIFHVPMTFGFSHTH